MSRKELPILNSCDGCGACCFTVSAPPFRIDHEYNEPLARGLPPELLEELLSAWHVRLMVSDSPCIWFDPDTLRCRHYEFRPTACREFEINSPSCRAARAEFLSDQSAMPGSKSAELRGN